MSGRLVGVPTSILSRSGGSNGIGFAVPATLVARVIEAAEAGADRLPRPWLGVETAEVDRDIAAALGLTRPRGLIVEALHPESPLARAGIRRGDVLLTAGESDLATPADLAYRAAALGPDARLTLTYLRNGAAAKARIPLAAPPERPPRNRTTFRRGVLSGLTVEAVNPAVIAEHGLSATAAGVRVLAVEGPARRTGLRPGDVIRAAGRTPVETPRELARSVQRAGGRLAMEVARGGRTGRVVLGR